MQNYPKSNRDLVT